MLVVWLWIKSFAFTLAFRDSLIQVITYYFPCVYLDLADVTSSTVEGRSWWSDETVLICSSFTFYFLRGLVKIFSSSEKSSISLSAFFYVFCSSFSSSTYPSLSFSLSHTLIFLLPNMDFLGSESPLSFTWMVFFSTSHFSLFSSF
jgi:hypothetical protein